MDLKLDQLRALVAVVDEGSFTDAATELHLSQAAVSRAVAALERTVGGRLLHRTTRSLRPTALGAEVLPAARRVLAAAEELERTVRRERAELRVGFAWAALGRHTAPLQRAWAATHPERRLVLQQVSAPDAGLDSGVVDVAIVRHAVDPERFDCALVGSERRFAILAPDHPLATRRELRLADFAGHTIVLDTQAGTTTAALWEAAGVAVEFRAVRGTDEWLTLVESGQVAGITPEATLHQYGRPSLVSRPMRDLDPVQVWIAWRRQRPSPRPDGLIALARAAYAAPSGTDPASGPASAR